MKLDIQDEDFLENLTHEWQYDIAVLLKKHLQENNISGDAAKDVVGDFLFSLSMLYDQQGVEFDNESYLPRLAFTDDKGNLIVSKNPLSMHEFAYGNTDEAFASEATDSSQSKGLFGWFKK